MQVGEVANAEAAGFGKPLDGVRVLALEQMQALPFATQLMARLGADVVKIEAPRVGESGRTSRPAMKDPEGRAVGATFLRNNLNKRSVTIDVKHPRGRDLVLRLAPHFDIFGENFRAGAVARLGLGYQDVAAAHPPVIYVSVSGFGNTTASPYATWPAYAAVAEAMSGVYEFKRRPGEAPTASPVGALGDIATSLFATVGVLAALRHRDRTGQGQYVDAAMFDAMVAMTDVVTNYWSMGLGNGELGQVILTGFRAADGWFVLQVVREHQFVSLTRVIGCSEWLDDPRFAGGHGWVEHLDSDIRPAIERWAADKGKVAACAELSAAGLAAGPCLSAEEVVHDPHVAMRNMMVELPRTDGIAQPILIPGNPVKLSKMTEGPERRVPWLGEHTDDVLRDDLGLSEGELRSLRADGILS